jgi:hypothetical protein
VITSIMLCATLAGSGGYAPAGAISGATADPSGQAVPGQIPGWTQTFTDDFARPSTLSNYQIYGGTPTDGSNACFAPSHVAVTGGEMVLKAFRDTAAIVKNGCTGDADQMVTGGVKLTSNSQTYGKYEIRMRVDNGQGVSVVALLWPTGDTWPPEIDFTEDNGASPRTVDTATEHWGSLTSAFQIHDTLAVDLTRWHTVGVEWTPGKIVYTMDGMPWATETNANVSDVPMQLAIQTQAWQCGVSSWEQCTDDTTPGEVDMDVDWIAVYSPGEQPSPVDHVATVPAATPGDSSVPLLAVIAGLGLGGGLLLALIRRRRQAQRLEGRIR